MHKRLAIGSAIVLSLATVFIWMYMPVTSIPVLYPHGVIGKEELRVMGVTFALSSIVVIPVFVLLFLFAWKYRADNAKTAHRHSPAWDHTSGVAEFVWWLVPSVIIAILSVIAWQSSHELDPYEPIQGRGAPMVIQVVALDWKWLFIYPEEGIASVNSVEFPVESPVRFEITADAPMNSFWIPALGGQIMAMPGMSTILNLRADDIGTFNGVSANISGAGFAGMTFQAKAVSSKDFAQWVERVKYSSSTLSQTTYDTLALPSRDNPVTEYAPVDRGLYSTIIMKYMAPAHDSMDGMSMDATATP